MAIDFLGQPIGYHDFAPGFLHSKARDYTTATTHLLGRLIGTQTQCSLLKDCTQSTSIPHHLASDIDLYTLPPPALSKWKSPFISSIVNSNHHFLSHVLKTFHPLPAHALFITSYPAQDTVTNAIINLSWWYPYPGLHTTHNMVSYSHKNGSSLCHPTTVRLLSS